MILRIKKFYINKRTNNDLHTRKEKVLEDYLNLGLEETDKFPMLNFSSNLADEKIGSFDYKKVNFKNFIFEKIPSFVIQNTTQSFMKELFLNTGSIKNSLKTLIGYGNEKFGSLITSLTVGTVTAVNSTVSQGITSGLINQVFGSSGYVDYLFAKETLSEGKVIYEDFVTGAEVYTNSSVEDMNFEIVFDYTNLTSNRARAIKYLQDLFFIQSLVLPLKPTNGDNNNNSESAKVTAVEPIKDSYTTLITDIPDINKLNMIDIIEKYRSNFNIIHFGNRNIIYKNNTDFKLPQVEFKTSEYVIDLTKTYTDENQLTFYKILYQKLLSLNKNVNNLFVENDDGTYNITGYGYLFYGYYKHGVLSLYRNTTVIYNNDKLSYLFFDINDKYNIDKNKTSNELLFYDIMINLVTDETILENFTVAYKTGGISVMIDPVSNKLINCINSTVIQNSNTLNVNVFGEYYVTLNEDAVFIIDTSADIVDTLQDLVVLDVDKYTPTDKYKTSYELSDTVIKILSDKYFDETKVLRIGTVYQPNLIDKLVFDDFISSLGLKMLKWNQVESDDITNKFPLIYGVSFENSFYDDNIYLPFQKNVTKGTNFTVPNFYNGSINTLKNVENDIGLLEKTKTVLNSFLNALDSTFLTVPPILRLAVLGLDGEELMKYEDFICTNANIVMDNNFYLYKHIDFVKQYSKLSKNNVESYYKDNWNLLIPNKMSVSLKIEQVMSHPYEVIAQKYFNLQPISVNRQEELYDGIITMLDTISEPILTFVDSLFTGDILVNDSSDDSLYVGLSDKLAGIDTKLQEIYDINKNNGKAIHIYGKRDAYQTTEKGSTYSQHYIQRAIDLRFNWSDPSVMTGFDSLADDYIVSFVNNSWNVYLKVKKESIKVEPSPYVVSSVTRVFLLEDASDFSNYKTTELGQTIYSNGTTTSTEEDVYRYIDISKLFKKFGLKSIKMGQKNPTNNWGGTRESNYAEWWHWQDETGLVGGMKYVDLLKQVQGDEVLTSSDSAHKDEWIKNQDKVVWNGTAFVVK